MGVQKRLMRILTTIDTIWLNEVLPAGPNCTSQISYEAVASVLLAPSTFAVQLCFMDIIAKYNGTSEAPHAHIDDDRYDMVECDAAGQP